MTEMDFLRVLIVAPVRFSEETGSGVTMSRLFRGWPPEDLAQAHSDRFSRLDESVCRQYLYLPYEQVRGASAPASLASFARQAALFLSGRQESLAGHWLHTGRFLEWAQRFQPDLIYARPMEKPSFYLWLPLFLSRALSVPYVTRILDDWPARQAHAASRLRRLHWQLFLRRVLQRVFDGSSANLAISEEMSRAFEARYRRPFIPIQGGIEVPEWLPVEKNYETGDEFRLVYLGTVTRDKELASLKDVSAAVLDLRELGYPVCLTIYGPEIYRAPVLEHLACPPAIVHGGFFPPAEKPQVLSRADLLVLPVNFDRDSRAYAGTSFQTKLPEYMASGTPVLVYGPPDNPNVRYAASAGWGAVVDRPERAWLKETIMNLLKDQDLRARLGQRARALALRDHDAEAIRQRFRQILFAAARRDGA